MSDTIGYPDAGLDLSDGFKPHTSHWGVFSARLGEAGLEVRPYADDPDPNGIIDNFPAALRHSARIAEPKIRRGWLERGPGPDDRRGRDEFVSVSWDKALDLLAGELSRIRDTRGGRPTSEYCFERPWQIAAYLALRRNTTLQEPLCPLGESHYPCVVNVGVTGPSGRWSGIASPATDPASPP